MTERTSAPIVRRAREEQAQRRRFEAIAGSSFLAGAAQFFLLNTVAESLYQGYNVKDQALSELGVGQVALLWNTSLFLIGVTAIIGGYFAYLSLSRRLTLSFSLVLGIGCMGAAIFPLDSTIHIHGLFALLAFAGGGLLALTSYRVTASKEMKIFSIIFGLYSLAALILHALEINLGLGGGGMERMIVFPLILWLSAFAGYLLHTKTEQSVGTPKN
jgi:hypothetical protein